MIWAVRAVFLNKPAFRYLSLWAASGQSALESARVLVLSASATSVQALKNLVLPGEYCAPLLFICRYRADAV